MRNGERDSTGMQMKEKPETIGRMNSGSRLLCSGNKETPVGTFCFLFLFINYSMIRYRIDLSTANGQLFSFSGLDNTPLAAVSFNASDRGSFLQTVS